MNEKTRFFRIKRKIVKNHSLRDLAKFTIDIEEKRVYTGRRFLGRYKAMTKNFAFAYFYFYFYFRK